MMRSYRQCSLLLALIVLLFVAVKVSAQEKYPDRPITIVAPFPPGGVADLTARPVAAALEKVLKNPVVVVNKTAVSGGLIRRLGAGDSFYGSVPETLRVYRKASLHGVGNE
jgi:hypothetical protein